MSEISATIKLKADRSGFTGEIKGAIAEVDKLNAGLRRTHDAGNQGASGIHTYYTNLDRGSNSSKRLATETGSLRSQFLSLKSILATVGFFTVGREMVNTLAQFQDTRTMLKGLTRDAQDYNDVQQYLLATSRSMSQNYNELAKSYAQILNLESAGIVTRREGIEVLEGMVNAGARLGASQAQIGQAMYGLSQSFASGIVSVEDMRQATDPLPGLLQYVSASAGLVGNELKEMVATGTVTSEFFKTHMLVALKNYEGAALGTYENVSASRMRIATEHGQLVAALEAPIANTVGSFLKGYADGVQTLVTYMPELIELTGDLTTVLMALGAIKLVQYLYGVAAASSIATASMYGMSARTAALIVVTNAWTAALAGARAALTFIGGPAGIAIMAGMAVYAFGNRSDEAATKTAALRAQVDELVASFSELTVSDIDNQISDTMANLNAVNSVLDQMQKPVNPGTGRAGDSAHQIALEEYSQKLINYGQLQAHWAQRVSALASARSDAVTRGLKAESEATAALSEKQQELLDKYVPLDKLAREYHAELTALNAIEVTSAEQAQRKATAIDTLNAMYQQEVRDISGVTRTEEAALKVREKTLQQMTQLIDEYAPLQNSQGTYMAQLTLLTQARDEDLLSLQNYHIAVAALAQEQYNSLNPGAEIITQLQAELTALRLTGDELEFYTLTHGLSAEQVAKHGDEIRALIATMREEQAGLDALEAAQKAYQQSTETMLDDLQRSWGDMFQELLRGGKVTMRDLSSTVLDIWTSTMARMMSMDMSNAFRSAMAPGDTGGAPGSSSGTGSFNWGQLASVVGGGVSSVLSASMIKSSAPIYEGGQLISEGAKSLNFSLSNLGTNLVAGYAGGKLGTMAGEAVFGKTAQSSWGATAGAVIGAFVPVIGPFLGAAIGGALDAAFGGDGYKRSSMGFDTGRDSVRDSYYAGTETFASGLTVNKVNRRGDVEVMDAVVSKAAEIDAFITSAARAAGGTLSMAGRRLNGTSADYGNDSGSFFGKRIGDGQDSEAALDAMFASFSTQLIGHIEGLSVDVTQAMRNATGSADEILQQFQEALALDQLVKSGALDILGDQVNFTFAQQLVEAAGGLDNLSAATAAFNNSVADSATAQENVVDRLRSAVDEQFAAINLTLSDFSSVEQFRDHFDEVKNSLDAVDVLKLVQAGNALSVLIEQEKVLVDVRSASMTEQLDSAQEMFDTYKGLRAQANALAGTIANDIFKLSGTGATDLRSRMRTGSYDEQLDVIDQLRQQILANFNEELKLKQELHDAALDHYEQQLDAARSIREYIQGVMTGDLSPLSVADRLTTAQAQFDDVVQRALSGDLTAGQQAADYFDTLAKLNQTANASSAAGVENFYANLAKLQSVETMLSQAQAPGALNTDSLASTYIAQLQELQAEVLRVQSATAVDLVGGLGSLKLLLEQLPAKMALELMNVLPGALSNTLQLATNLGILSLDVRNALGLLPQRIDLSSVGIASQIEAVTQLSQHPELMAENLTTISAAMGAMMQQMVAMGVSTHMLADILSKNPGSAAAANQYLADNNLGSLTDYTSSVNSNYSAQEINDYVQSAIAQAANEEAAVRAVMSAAIAGGVGSGQLAASTGYSQEDILALAAKYGYASFDVGTDRVTHDQLALNHKDEMIFTSRESGSMRKAIVERVSAPGADPESMARLLRAVEAQSQLLAQLVAGIESVSGQQQSAFAESSREIRESVDRLTREIEELAA